MSTSKQAEKAGSISGLTLHDGYNPFRFGELAKRVAKRVHKLALAKSTDEWIAARGRLRRVEERVVQTFLADRSEFVRRAQAAGLNYTEADGVFRRLEEAVAEAGRHGGEIRCWFTPNHRKRIMASVGYRPGDDLVPGEDGWALSWQYNAPHVKAAIVGVLHAVNELDRVAAVIPQNATPPAPPPPPPPPPAEAGDVAELAKRVATLPPGQRDAVGKYIGAKNDLEQLTDGPPVTWRELARTAGVRDEDFAAWKRTATNGLRAAGIPTHAQPGGRESRSAVRPAGRERVGKSGKTV